MRCRNVQKDVDRLYLKSAIQLAAKGLHLVTRNNPRVGCLFVKHGQVVSRGFHRRDGGPHAEIEAIRNATGDLSDCVAYVSLEPCSTHGRTPPCCEALIDVGVGRVVVAESDPNPFVSGQGLKRLEKSGIEVSIIEIPEAESLNPGYRKRMKYGQPFVRLKVGMSVDGRVGAANGESQWITCSKSRIDVHKLRARSGAIVSGIGTVLADDPRLNVRLDSEVGPSPIRVIFDTDGRIPPNAKLLETESKVIVVCRDGVELPENFTTWRHTSERGDAREVVTRLGEEGVNEVLVEAGPELTGTFLNSGVWDELVVYMAPLVLGFEGMPMAKVKIDQLSDAIGGRVASVEQIGDDVRIVIENVSSGKLQTRSII
ncbi:MAG: bifunctional diaminohydroxyphosphoribosylaminopyrimidine deaminase/5-amino-6-(5-phosphoribosylamino)uracil reductase RibD [Gammaproteobacteria bacterium]|nr:bifunctional diaminohydroxyphosphoribosylaminopyrimidine deaminase/5-amino-6-(5-phosphoribosylamino)uracil reductase RibD [Gammaproteobacteria bacterium]